MGPRVGVDGCGKSRPHTGIRSPDRPARSKSLPLPQRLYHTNNMSTTKGTAPFIPNRRRHVQMGDWLHFPLSLLPGKKPQYTFYMTLFGRYGRFRENKNLLTLSEFEYRTVDCTYSNCIMQLVGCLASNVIKRQGWNGITPPPTKKKLISKTIIQLLKTRDYCLPQPSYISVSLSPVFIEFSGQNVNFGLCLL